MQGWIENFDGKFYFNSRFNNEIKYFKSLFPHLFEFTLEINMRKYMCEKMSFYGQSGGRNEL